MTARQRGSRLPWGERLAAQPIGEHVGRAFVEQIDRAMRLQIDQQRAVAALLPSQSLVISG